MLRGRIQFNDLSTFSSRWVIYFSRSVGEAASVKKSVVAILFVTVKW